MKKYILIIAVAFVSCNGVFQKKKHIILPKKVNYCKLPIDTSKILFGFFGEPPTTYHFKDGTSCEDTTGFAEFKRRKQIGDTDIYQVRFDTSRVVLLTMVGGIKLYSTVLKVVDNS